MKNTLKMIAVAASMAFMTSCSLFSNDAPASDPGTVVLPQDSTSSVQQDSLGNVAPADSLAKIPAVTPVQ